jgi:hypothetical protein
MRAIHPPRGTRRLREREEEEREEETKRDSQGRRQDFERGGWPKRRRLCAVEFHQHIRVFLGAHCNLSVTTCITILTSILCAREIAQFSRSCSPNASIASGLRLSDVRNAGASPVVGNDAPAHLDGRTVRL